METHINRKAEPADLNSAGSQTGWSFPTISHLSHSILPYVVLFGIAPANRDGGYLA